MHKLNISNLRILIAISLFVFPFIYFLQRYNTTIVADSTRSDYNGKDLDKITRIRMITMRVWLPISMVMNIQDDRWQGDNMTRCAHLNHVVFCVGTITVNVKRQLKIR